MKQTDVLFDQTKSIPDVHNIVDISRHLLKVASENPPGNTEKIAENIKSILQSVPGITVQLHSVKIPITNLVAVIRGRESGRRLILNGHLDTFPIGNIDNWDYSPFGEIHEGRLYGRGIADMKGGLAASILAAVNLAKCRQKWKGELVLTFAGDEEVMGELGTQALIDQIEFAKGDAMLSGDAGSTRVLRFGEKGMLWLSLKTHGHSGHAAHVHLGASAIDRMINAIRGISHIRVRIYGLSTKIDFKP